MTNKTLNNLNKPVTMNNLRTINIFSWNIQSSGNKFTDVSFTNTFKGYDLVCLQETRQTVKCQGFRSLCSVRKCEKSGGVCILFRNEHIGGVERVKKYNNPDFIICKLKKSFYKLKKDIFIVNAYIRPYNSTLKGSESKEGGETMKELENILNELHKEGDVVICGDFNARISNHPGLLTNDETDEHIPLPDDYIPDNFKWQNLRRS